MRGEAKDGGREMDKRMIAGMATAVVLLVGQDRHAHGLAGSGATSRLGGLRLDAQVVPTPAGLRDLCM